MATVHKVDVNQSVSEMFSAAAGNTETERLTV
jgi:hypothetical protein